MICLVTHYTLLTVPTGTYNGVEGGRSVDDCVDCDVGKYCNKLGDFTNTLSSSYSLELFSKLSKIPNSNLILAPFHNLIRIFIWLHLHPRR